ncbi:hypothetical protein EJB05_32037, partial [Eragrostis curvula]
MPGQRTPAAARLGGGPITRRHAELLLQSGGGVCVKDLRIRRVVPPASASLNSSPDCAAAEKLAPVERTPPEAVSAAAAEDLERRPIAQMLPRSKLVRDPGSFGYRRLLPFLNQMAKNGNILSYFESPFIHLLLPSGLVRISCSYALPLRARLCLGGSDGSSCNEMPSEYTSANSGNDLKRSRIWLVEESADGRYRESDPLEPAEQVVLKTGGGLAMKDGCAFVEEETSHDLGGSKPWLTRCARSKFVHQQSSFSYKRMLPFLMENEISSQEGERVKFRRVAEERQLTPEENDVSVNGDHHLAASEDSSSGCKRAQVENMEEEKEEKASNADVNHVLEDRQLQPSAPKVTSPECCAAEVQNAIQEEASTLNQDQLTSYEDESTSDGIDVSAGGQHQLPVTEDSPEECSGGVVKTKVQDTALKSDGSYVLEPAVPEVSHLEDSTSEGQKVREEQPLTSDGEEGSTLTSEKGEFLAKEQPQLCDRMELLTVQVEGTADFPQGPQCQSSDMGCPDVGFGSPTKTVIPLFKQCSLEHQDAAASLDHQHLDAVMICRPSDPCVLDRVLSVEEMAGSILRTESGLTKAGIKRPSEAHSLVKQGSSPKKLSPRKGILKRHTRGCKGICMCLDCSMFRLRADRAFEFSRKQMQEADDIIGNLLKEVATLRSLVEKPAGQQESTQAACERAFRVEEVARDRCRQMFLDLNSHCRIPGPRVRFAQYVEEKLGSSPPSIRRAEDKLGSSPPSIRRAEDKLGSSPRSNSGKRRDADHESVVMCTPMATKKMAARAKKMMAWTKMEAALVCKLPNSMMRPLLPGSWSSSPGERSTNSTVATTTGPQSAIAPPSGALLPLAAGIGWLVVLME